LAKMWVTWVLTVASVTMHGTGSSRHGVVRHARTLTRHGYGVLAVDLRGHGASDGRSTSAPWKLDDDIDHVVKWLAARPDADRAKIGLLGVSLGGAVALRVAARRRDVRATVADGAMGGARDAQLAGACLPVLAQLTGLTWSARCSPGRAARPMSTSCRASRRAHCCSLVAAGDRGRRQPRPPAPRRHHDAALEPPGRTARTGAQDGSLRIRAPRHRLPRRRARSRATTPAVSLASPSQRRQLAAPTPGGPAAARERTLASKASRIASLFSSR